MDKDKLKYWESEGYEGDTKTCEDCGGLMTWCSCCLVYTKTCCVEYGTCMCS